MIHLLILLAASTLLTLLIPRVLLTISQNNNNNNNNIPGINPPGPQGLPFIGNLHQFDKSKPHIYLWRLSQKYGPLAYLTHGSVPILVVSSSKIAKEILKTHDRSFCSRPPVAGQKRLSYGGLDLAFSPYNNHWKEMRRICVLHLLSTKQVLAFRSIREDEVSRMIRKIRGFSSSHRPVNLSETAMSVASNFICRVGFGRRYEDDEYEKMRLDRLIMEAQALMVSFYWSDHFPGGVGVRWMDEMSGLMGRLRKNCGELDVFYQKLIDEHLDPSRTRPDREDIIDLMIHLKDQNPPCPNLDITWDHVKAMLMDLLVAATDTVAATIVWAVTALMLRPSLMNTTQSEIRQLVARKGHVDEDDLNKLPYLKAVLLETLRLYPPAPLIYRSQISPEPCMVHGYKIRPGTSIFINGWAIARDPEIWDRPDEFRPERFLPSKGLVDNNHNLGDDQKTMMMRSSSVEFLMIPFGGGRRGCPGMGMGLISTELTLANLLYAFDWAVPPSEMSDAGGDGVLDTNSLPGLTMHKKTPLVLLPTSFNMH